jgi:hypothetical protein
VPVGTGVGIVLVGTGVGVDPGVEVDVGPVVIIDGILEQLLSVYKLPFE